MRDLREVENIDEWLTGFAPFRNAIFAWKKWERRHEDWTHDHCWACFACVCDHRERFPDLKKAHEERGCYRHAGYAELEPGKYLWVCRTCFKRLKGDMNWTVASTED